MYQYIMQSKKLKSYLMILTILWISAISGTIVEKTEFIRASMPNVLFQSENPVLLLEDEYQGDLSIEERDEIVIKILSRFQGQIKESIKTKELYTVYAYTPLIDYYILTDRKKINLNLLYTYNEETDITTFIVATPIYNQDY